MSWIKDIFMRQLPKKMSDHAEGPNESAAPKTQILCQRGVHSGALVM